MDATNEHEEHSIPRQLPGLDQDNRFYWTAGAQGRLLICRCGDCRNYIHPPQPRCSRCGSGNVAPAPVSGLGRVKTYTVNLQVWMPGLPVPYIFAAVELEEQAGLYVFTNIIDCPVDDVVAGMPVQVLFERREDVYLPLFRPRTGR